jgi:catechol 2,3-dioxygenase-like lactoylglutathione lyase family enzyme
MIKPDNPNSEFQLGGINHVALVSSDMQKTVDFYSGVLGMPLIKSLDLPGGMGQHFFFDAGNGDCVAFFWFPDAADRVPGISSPAAIPGIGEITSSVSSMNHLAFHVPAEKFDEYRQRLKDKGVRVGPVLNQTKGSRSTSPASHALMVCTTPPTTKYAVALTLSFSRTCNVLTTCCPDSIAIRPPACTRLRASTGLARREPLAAPL